MGGEKGFTLIEIMIIVAILGLLMVIAVPNYLGSRDRAQQNVCISNLKRISDVKSVWAVLDNMGESDVPDWSDLVTAYLKSIPTCPAGGTYEINAVSEDPTCDVPGHSI